MCTCAKNTLIHFNFYSYNIFCVLLSVNVSLLLVSSSQSNKAVLTRQIFMNFFCCCIFTSQISFTRHVCVLDAFTMSAMNRLRLDFVGGGKKKSARTLITANVVVFFLSSLTGSLARTVKKAPFIDCNLCYVLIQIKLKVWVPCVCSASALCNHFTLIAIERCESVLLKCWISIKIERARSLVRSLVCPLSMKSHTIKVYRMPCVTLNGRKSKAKIKWNIQIQTQRVSVVLHKKIQFQTAERKKMHQAKWRKKRWKNAHLNQLWSLLN